MMRSLLRTLISSGLVAAIGYMMMPRRRRRFFMFSTRRPRFRRDMWKMGRSLVRALAR